MLTSTDIVAAYHAEEAHLNAVFTAFRAARSRGFRLCQYQSPAGKSTPFFAAVFCLSIFHRDSLFQPHENTPTFRAAVMEAIEQSPLLKEHVAYLIHETPVISPHFKV